MQICCLQHFVCGRLYNQKYAYLRHIHVCALKIYKLQLIRHVYLILNNTRYNIFDILILITWILTV